MSEIFLKCDEVILAFSLPVDMAKSSWIDGIFVEFFIVNLLTYQGCSVMHLNVFDLRFLVYSSWYLISLMTMPSRRK